MKVIDKEETNIGAHAILLSQNGKVLLQQRDNNPEIVNPGLISMFGGTLNKKETPKQALQRELLEELSLDITSLPISKLGIFYKTKEIDNIDYQIHVFTLKNIEIEKLVLHEGKSIYNDSLESALKSDKLTRITRLALEKLNQCL